MANAAALRASTPAHPSSISIIKSSSDLIIAGYASVEMVDKQGDLITRGSPVSMMLVCSLLSN